MLRPIVMALLVPGLLLLPAVPGCMKDFAVPEQNSPAGRLFMKHCSLCHALPNPARMTFAQWAPVVERMDRNVRAQNLPEIPQEELSAILLYLKRYAKSTPS